MNNIFYIYVIILLSIIFYNALKGSLLKENFENNTNKNENNLNENKINPEKESTIVILLGDSILNNSSYVKKGMSVEDLLMKRLPNVKILNYSEQDGTISDVYNQLNKIPTKYIDANNKYKIKIYLSVGGNNILNNAKESVVVNDTIINNTDPYLLEIFNKYSSLLKFIRSKYSFPNVELYALNIYYPYQSNSNNIGLLYQSIKQWNNLLNGLLLTNNNINLLNIANIVKEKDDFTFAIEPSEKGGQKIANLIANTID